MDKKNCNKTSFIDQSNAEQYISKLQKTSKRKFAPVRSYLCEKCLNWHITSIEDNRISIVKKDLLKQIEGQKIQVQSKSNQIEKLKYKNLRMKNYIEELLCVLKMRNDEPNT